MPGDDLRERLGIERGGLVALVVAPGGYALATSTGGLAVMEPEPAPFATVAAVDAEVRPRWVMWSNATAIGLVEAGVRVATSWDIAAVTRLLFGGWRADPDRAWALVHDLPVDALPTTRPRDLFSTLADESLEGTLEEPVRGDGYLRPDWAAGAWADRPSRWARWADAALTVVALQQERLAAITECPGAAATARAESTAELLCAELTVDGLPMDRAVADALVEAVVGRRPRTEAEANDQRSQRDADVLRHLPGGAAFDLRSPGQVKSMLSGVGVDVVDTRAWRLESLREVHPVVGALLAWRKAERVATTYGYGWLDENLHPDGRLRGTWSGSDGAAGRMTASGGLHNMPADMRDAVVAEPGQVFVRADLGQIEPRVLAAVSGDAALAKATHAADMYAPVAAELGVDRATAEVAVLGAMYGQTTGHGARALRGLDAAYPVAMAYLNAADRAGQQARALRTYGGRLDSDGFPRFR